MEDAPSIEYMARHIAKTQQRYTQRGGVRPFGVSSMLAGFSTDGAPQLYLNDPAGTYSAWKVHTFSYFNSNHGTLSRNDCCCILLILGVSYLIVTLPILIYPMSFDFHFLVSIHHTTIG